MPKSTKEVTPKQARFVREYQLNYWIDATAAYRKAFKTPSTTSITTTRSNASRLLKEPHIAEYIKEQKKIAAKRSFVTIDGLVDRLNKSSKRSEKNNNEKSLNTSIMNMARLLGYNDGPRNTFVVRKCKTLDDIQTESQRALDEYSQGLLNDKEHQVIINNLSFQKQLIIDIELINQVKTLEEIKAALGK